MIAGPDHRSVMGRLAGRRVGAGTRSFGWILEADRGEVANRVDERLGYYLDVAPLDPGTNRIRSPEMSVVPRTATGVTGSDPTSARPSQRGAA